MAPRSKTVAQLAGLPQAITRRAGELLRQLEKEKHSSTPQLSLLDFSQATEQSSGQDFVKSSGYSSEKSIELSVEQSIEQLLSGQGFEQSQENISEKISNQNAYQDSIVEINSLREKIQQLETILREVGGFPLNQKTPIEAVMTISQWQQNIEKMTEKLNQ